MQVKKDIPEKQSCGLSPRTAGEIELTIYQAIFYNEWLLDPQRSDYNMVLDQYLEGELDVSRLNQSLIRLVNDLLLLNSNVKQTDGKYYWTARPELKPEDTLLVYHEKELSKNEVLQLAQEPFDLEKDQLVKLHLINYGQGKYRLIFILPHILVDGLSYDAILVEGSKYYNDAAYTHPISIVEQITLHNELSVSLNSLLQEHQPKMKAFWEQRLANVAGVDLTFLTAASNPPEKSSHTMASELTFAFKAEELAKIKSLSRSHGVTPYIYGQLVLGILLHKFTGQEHLGINFPVAITEGKEFIYGAHVNTVVIDYFIDRETTLDDLIKRTRRYYDDLKKSKGKYLPVDDLIKYAANNQVLEVSFVQANLRSAAIAYEGIQEVSLSDELHIDLSGALTFEQELRNDALNYRVRYNAQQLNEELVKAFTKYYQSIFNEILDDLCSGQQDKKIATYCLLSKEDYYQQLIGWNDTGATYPTDLTLHAWFEKQVRQTPESIAVVYQGVKLSYQELNERANRLANYLISEHQLKADELVLLCLDRSEHMLISILGVLKAGAAYVPMSPAHPAERISYILEDTQSRLILTNAAHENGLHAVSGDKVSILSVDHEDFGNYTAENPITATTPSHLAYVIYTSGTTGQPKGVMVEHTSVVNLSWSQHSCYRLEGEEVIMQFANYIFDASVEQIFLALLHGHQLLIIPENSWHDQEAFIQYAVDHKVTYVDMTPSFLEQVDVTNIPSLTKINSGGEALSISLLKKLQDRFCVINSYGPTETTVVSLANVDCKDNYIGRPILNTTVYVLDPARNPLPVGAIGELYIGGTGVTRGYLNQETLTNERFIANPFQTAAEKALGYNGKLYKTGDLVRYHADGNLEYMGRNDFQVKIRGYRIELGEIETKLSNHAEIKQSVVLALNDAFGNLYLVGYYVSELPINSKELHAYLGKELPQYMVPPVFVHLDKLPLTVNGKLDRKMLPEPVLTSMEDYHAPETTLQEQLTSLWGTVLGIAADQISIDADFFRMGGNSILAIKLMGRINKELGSSLKVADIFDKRTILEMSGKLSTDTGQKVQITAATVSAVEEQLLSYAQERLWFIENYSGGTSAYNIPMVMQLKSATNAEALEHAILSVIQRHEILRSIIKTGISGLGYQQVLDESMYSFKIKQLTVNSEAELQASISASAHHMFNLAESYPVVARLFHFGKQCYLSVVVHHIAFDGWSTDLFIQEVLYYYHQYIGTAGYEASLPELDLQYKDFALWQRNYLSGQVLEDQLAYWTAHLQGFELLQLPLDLPRPAQPDYAGAQEYFALDEQTSNAIRATAAELGVSLYSLLLSSYYLMLHIHSGQEDLVVGTPVSNRHHHQLQDMIGFFVNTLALRQTIDPEMNIEELVNKVAEMMTAAQEHQDLPFERLVTALGIPHDTSRHPVFQTMFALDDFGAQQSEELSKLFIPYEGAYDDVAKFDLTVNIQVTGAEIKGNINYATALFTADTIQSFVKSFVNLLGQLSGGKNKLNKKIKQLQVIDAQSHQQQVVAWNATDEPYSDQSLSTLFEDQVEKTPERIAIAYDGRHLSYRSLNECSNQLSHYLIKAYAISPQSPVLMMLDRSEQMLIAMLGILKAGAVYVPIDPAYPDERLNYILDDTQAKFILCNEIYADRIRAISPEIQIISLDDAEIQKHLAAYVAHSPENRTYPSDLAYIIYTSGTTGQPKGVMVEHGGVVNLVSSLHKKYEFTDGEVILQFANYVFDASVEQIFMALLHGHKLLLIKNESWRDQQAFVRHLADEQVSYLHMTPSFLEQLPLHEIPSLKLVNSGGEALSTSLLEKLSGQHFKLVNSYGPTETTVTSVVNFNSTNTRIGKPIANTKIYVLDKHLNVLPIGAIGELYIGGAGVARGYLNKEKLTAERFIPNPFQTREEAESNLNRRLYKTGDLVRYHTDGTLDYLGRNDSQVKIRGYRIELGEIEQALRNYPGITQSVVLVHEQSADNKYLVGYYIASERLNNDLIQQHLKDHLPAYMIPAVLIPIASMPLTVNGKLDRRALPLPVFETTCTYCPPQNERERKLCHIWAEVLGINDTPIGIDDDFFALGGNSIMAIKLISYINRELELGLKIADLFHNRTIRQLATQTKRGDEVIISADPVDGPEQQLLSYAQERLWFIHEYGGGSHTYNIPMVLGIHAVVDIEKLIQAIHKVVGRHEILRTLIKKSETGEAYQQLIDMDLHPFSVGISTYETHQQLTEGINVALSKIFDLSSDYPIAVKIHQFDDMRYISLVVHHIAFDGWSTDVFIQDVLHYYEGGLNSEKNKPVLQYKDFALWQRNHLQGSNLEQQLAYWVSSFEDHEPLSLPSDQVRPALIDYKGADESFSINELTSNKLRETARAMGVSMYTLLLGGYYLMLQGFSGQDDIIVGMPVANRNHTQTQNMIGFFVNMLAIRVKINAAQKIAEFIKALGKQIEEAQSNQDLPFERLIEFLDLTKDLSRHPLFQVTFSLQGFDAQNQEPFLNLFYPYKDNQEHTAAKFDLTLTLDDRSAEITGIFNYATSIFTAKTIKKYIGVYLNILEQLCLSKQENTLKTISYQKEIPSVIPFADEQQWSTLQQLFEQQVLLSPENIALVCQHDQISYSALNKQANQFAHYLQEVHHIQANDLVVLCFDCSEHFFIAMLAVMKAGAAYVPVDPASTADRKAYVLNDTGAKVMLTHEHYSTISKEACTLADHCPEVIITDTSAFATAIAGFDDENPDTTIDATALAYVIYTSGTTGQPKGVMVEHRNVHEYFLGLSRQTNIKQCKTFGLVTPPVFDLAATSIYAALLTGGALHIFTEADLSDAAKMREADIDYLKIVPSLFASLEEEGLIFMPKKCLVFGGEALPKELIDQIKKLTPSCHIYNHYGPTETTIGKLLRHVEYENTDFKVNLGYPIGNARVYILDPHQRLLPDGAVGEICISGDGVARGYLNKPEITAEKFIADPFHPGKLMYRTGDLGRLCEDGSIAYLGRTDFQVKLNGFRIELGEIETALTKYQGIKQVVVLVKGQPKHLIAYYVADAVISDELLLQHLSAYLPAYMLPAAFIHLTVLPLASSGKLDRKKLPDPEFKSTGDYIAPKSSTEAKLCDIWAELLNIPANELSVTDDFFRLGGNSIMAIKLVSRINKALDVHLHIADLFKNKTIRQLAAHMQDTKGRAVVIEKSIVEQPEDNLLSFAQERLWFIDLYEEEGNSYNIPLSIKLQPIIDETVLIQSIRTVIHQHEVLRSNIRTTADGTGYQEVIDDTLLPVEIAIIDLDGPDQLQKLMTEAANHVFSLKDSYPIEVKLFRCDTARYLSIVVHHIAFDGWSIQLFLKEMLQYYRHYQSGGMQRQVQSPALQYRDYALWQRHYLAGDVLHKQLAYWTERLNGYETLLLPTDHERPLKQSHQGGNLSFVIANEMRDRLSKVASDLGVSRFSLLLSGYYLLLQAYSGQDDIVLGTPVANRHYPQIQDMIGFFANVLVLRAQIDHQQKLVDFIREVAEMVEMAQIHQDLPFEQLVSALKTEPDSSRHPVFQVMFTLSAFEEKNDTELSELFEVEDIGDLYNAAKFDLTLSMRESEEGLSGMFNYSTQLFELATINSFQHTYLTLLEQLAALESDDDKCLNDLHYRSDEHIASDMTALPADYPVGYTLQRWFEHQVVQSPDAMALVYGTAQLTYRELNTRVNQLAHYLRAQYGLKTEDPVLLLLDRSEQMLITMLAVLKAGGAYVPLDPEYPAARIEYILKDTGSQLMLTNAHHAERLQTSSAQVLAVDSAAIQTLLVLESAANPENQVAPDHLAYILYTSGTTGQPKGVMVEHQNLVNFVYGQLPLLDKSERIAGYLSYTFDAVNTEIYPALLNGHTLYLTDQETRSDLFLLYQFILKHQITFLVLPAIVASDFSQYDLSATSLRVLITGGDVFQGTRYPGIRYINAYGPTEATVCAIYHEYAAGSRDHQIGTPLPNVSVYVLDEHLRLLPEGAIGELYIGGAGVSRGYLNRADQTAKSFIQNPYAATDGYNRLYKTGDQVRSLPDCSLLYLGRKDRQVKLRGYRIELGEIESCLHGYPDIHQSYVMIKEQGNGSRYLAGYYVASSALSEAAIRAYLSAHLPDYMIPSALVHLQEFPLTLNGKIAVERLPVPEFDAGGIPYRAPETALQEELCQIWASVLGIAADKIGMDDDFFQLGGDSIMAIKLVSRINNELKAELRISNLFSNKTIAKLAVELQDKKTDTLLITPQEINSVEEQRLSYAQERLWFIDQYAEGSSVYNIPVVVRLKAETEINQVFEGIQLIIQRHEVLRSLIKTDVHGIAYQLPGHYNGGVLAQHQHHCNHQEELDNMLAKDAGYVFNLMEEYPIRFTFYQLREENYLSIVVHHIAFDGWSAQIFMQELQTYCNTVGEEDQSEFMKTPILQYKDYALWQRRYLQGDELSRQLTYWRNQLSGYETLNLPLDFPRPATFSYEGAIVHFPIGHTLSEALKAKARALGVTNYSLLLSGYYLMLQAHSGQHDIVIGTPVSNRHHHQTQQTIGFFANTLALRQQLDDQMSCVDFIRQVAAMVEEVQNYQDLPFERLIDELSVPRDSTLHPVFQVMFVLDAFGASLTADAVSMFEPYDLKAATTTAKFDLTLGIQETGEGLSGMFNYSTQLFELATINAFQHTYLTLLEQLAGLESDDDTSLKDLYYHSDEHIVSDIAALPADYPAGYTLQRWFEQQVTQSPDALALVYGATQLSYQQLNTRSNQLAHYLRVQCGLKTEDPVLLLLDRSEHMLITILAVLKAGGAYVPLDPEYPAARIDYILKDTGSQLMLTNVHHAERLQTGSAKVLAVDSPELQALLRLESIVNPDHQVNPDQLAYILYTSGTTGQPKGVMVEHRNLVNFVYGQLPLLDKSERIAGYLSYTFDAVNTEIYPALLNGHTLYLTDQETRSDLFLLYQFILKHQITFLVLPAIVASDFSQYDLSATSLRVLITGGDVFQGTRYSGIRYINAYGPTEATVCAAYHEYAAGSRDHQIGTPLPNVSVYVLDEHLRLLPQGAIGELYIGGAGVSRGYLNREDQTAKSFIQNPYAGVDGYSRLYKTGDQVRSLPDGSLLYLGRKDRQVKLRGYRIELGEIESCLHGYPDIHQSYVMLREQGNGSRYLAGYYVAPSPLPEAAIRAYLSAHLPDYMIPSALVHLQEFPLTLNGKMAVERLPIPEFDAGGTTYRAPETALQEELCQIWASVLGIAADKIGMDDDFFQLGGDSIISIQLTNRIRQQTGIHISVKSVFTHKTIARLSNHLDTVAHDAVQLETEQGMLSGNLSLLPIQQWFFHNVDQGNLPEYQHWNQAFLIKVPQLDLAILNQSNTLLLEYHDMLRAGFRVEEGIYLSSYQSDTDVNIEYFDATGSDQAQLHELFTQWQSNFNVFGRPILTIAYIENYLGDGYRVFFALHHLIVDAVSWRLLNTDLERLYTHLEAVEEANRLTVKVDDVLGKKGTSYRQWTTAIENYSTSGAKSGEQQYWEAIETDVLATRKQLPYSNSENSYNFSLDVQTTDLLLRSSGQKYNTQINDILLAALALALSDVSGKHQHSVLLESHGRESFSERYDLSRTVGWFTTMHPVILSANNENPEQTLIAVKESLRSIPNNGIGFGALMGYHPERLPQIAFNYLGQFDEGNKNMQHWTLTAEDTGNTISAKNKKAFRLGINSGIIGGRLTIGFSGQLSNELITALAEHYQSRLETLILQLSQTQRSFLTPSDVDCIVAENQLNKLQTTREINGVYLANSLQEGFIYHALYHGAGDDAYMLQQVWDYTTAIDTELLKISWSKAQERYDSLRLRFSWEEDLLQVIDSKGIVDWRYRDISHLSIADQQLEEAALLTTDRKELYDLSVSGLFRIYLLKRSSTLYTCIFSIHHAIIDGWSVPILLQYVHEVYLKLLKKEHILAERDLIYSNVQHYLQDQRQLIDHYWTDYLAKLDTKASINGLLKKEHQGIKIDDRRLIREHCTVESSISDHTYRELKKMCTDLGVTVNAVLHYLWHKQLSLYTEGGQTVVGMTVSGRGIPVDGVEESVGLFINTLPVIVDHSDENLITTIQRLQTDINEINGRTDVRLGQLQPKEGGRLFNSLFVYENYPVNYEEDKFNELTLEFRAAIEKDDYPLSLMAYERGDQVNLRLKYAGELFEYEKMTSILKGIQVLLEQLLADPQLKNSTLKLLSEEDQQLQLVEWNKRKDTLLPEETIADLFVQRAVQHPHSIAIVCGENSLSYAQLNSLSGQLAIYLQEQYELNPDAAVLLFMDRSVDMLVSIMGALKAGAAYVPVSPAAPVDRLSYILEDTAARIILTQKRHVAHLQAHIKGHDGIIIALDDEQIIEELNQYKNRVYVPVAKPTDLAYIIYTSGTTGRPKGVMIEHRTVINTLHSLAQSRRIKHGSRVLCTANYVFDSSVAEILTSMVYGATLYLTEDAQRFDLDYMLNYVSEHHITQLFLTTRLAEVVLADASYTAMLQGIETLTFAGELFTKNLINPLPGRVLNEYGPTEASICSSVVCYEDHIVGTLIGRPLTNTTAYVLNQQMQPVPLGAIGELYIGGAGVARGYLNQPALTAERFLPNPFQTDEEKVYNYNSRIYKTGDLVRYDESGNLEYIGRNDFQVKLRGYRIELGEIEVRLAQYPGIRQAVVLFKESANPYLVGYYVGDTALNQQDIYAYLEENLPDYMVPSVLIPLDEIPLTQNGKMDRSKLPEPELQDRGDHVAAQTPLEQQLVTLWSSVLGMSADHIGVNDDFFRLGGNSILAIKLVGKINRELGTSIKIADVFAGKTIARIAERIIAATDQDALVISMNRVESKKLLFMIHPAQVGCEVYTQLAEKISSYHCYGVNSYNFNNDDKIEDLHQLASLYLAEIDKTRTETGTTDEDYHLLGWSLGGRVALEIAAILEARGIKNIKVYLLDAVYYTHDLPLPTEDEITMAIEENRQYFQDMEDYEERAKALLLTEFQLGKQALSGKLSFTDVILFKALKPMGTASAESSLIQSTPDNGIHQVLNDKGQLKIIDMPKVSHRTILEDEETLLDVIQCESSQK